MASPDDIACLSSICQALRGVLANPAGLTRESSDEVSELLALISQVFSADSHHGRVAQLLHACHPFAAVAPFLSLRTVAASFSLRCSVMDCVKATVAATTVVHRHTEPPSDKLQHLVGLQLREAEVVPYLLQLLASSSTPVESTGAAELLFVLVMSLPATVPEDIRRTDGGIALLILHALHGRPAPPQQQVLACAILRCLATEYADVLTAPDLAYLSRAFSALSTFRLEDPSQPYQNQSNTTSNTAAAAARGGGAGSESTTAAGRRTSISLGSSMMGVQSRRAAVLTLETMTELLSAFPSAYWDAKDGQGREGLAATRDVMRLALRRLVLDSGLGTTLGGKTESKSPLPDEASVDEVLAAAGCLVRVLLRLEGIACAPAQPPQLLVVYPLFNSPAVFREAASNAVSSKISCWRLSLLRCAAFEALQYATQSPLVSCVLESFPLLCSLLVPNRSTARCMREAALLIGVALAKSPSARREVQRMVEGYEAWAQLMSSRITQLLAHVFRYATRGGAGGISSAQTTSTSSNVVHRGNGSRNVSLGSVVGARGDDEAFAEAGGSTSEPGTTSVALDGTDVPIDLESLVLVDVFHTILNDGDQAQHVDLVNEERIARALLHEQDRRLDKSSWSAGGSGASPSSAPLPLDTEYIEATRQATASRRTPRARELSVRLALAVLTEAVLQAFTTSSQASSDSLAVLPSSPTRRQRSPVRAVHSLGATARSSPGRPVVGGATSLASPTQTPPPFAPVTGSVSSAAVQHRAVSPSSSSYATARGGGGGVVGGAFSPAAVDPQQQRRPRPRSAGASSRYEQWIDEHLGKPQPKTLGSFFAPHRERGPFRPSSYAAARTLSPGRTSPRPRAAAAAAAPNLGPRGVAQPILDVVRDAPVGSDEYLSMAIMMHLPIRFGPHYNRSGKAAVRKVVAPHGVFLQPIRRSQRQSWSVADVRVGELHVIFIPFSKLSCQRVEEELGALDRHVVELGKLLVTTPNTQRSRRWFLQDMVHDVLPKTELLLRDLLDILYKFGVDDVVYQLSIIRVADEGRRQNSGVFASAVELSDTAMPLEILRLSSGSFRDILHSGNIVFAVQQLRQHYYESKGAASSSHPSQLHTTSSNREWVALTEVDEEILSLERQQQRHSGQSAPQTTDTRAAPGTNERTPAAAAVSSSPLRWSRPVTSVPSHLLSQYQRALSHEDDDEVEEGGDNGEDVGQLQEDARRTVSDVYRGTE